MSSIKLVYFPSRAKGECIRLILHAAQQDFEDVRIPPGPMNAENKAATPYGQVPYVIYNGKKYGQSVAIATFFARKFGFYGKSDEDGLREAEVIELFQDFWSNANFYFGWFAIEDAAKKEESAKRITNEVIPRYFGYFENLLKDNGSSGFFVGNSVTLADLVIYDGLVTSLGLDSACLSSFPLLEKLRQNVETFPALKNYLATRPKPAI